MIAGSVELSLHGLISDKGLVFIPLALVLAIELSSFHENYIVHLSGLIDVVERLVVLPQCLLKDLLIEALFVAFQ